jgi:WD40 repeat protein
MSSSSSSSSTSSPSPTSPASTDPTVTTSSSTTSSSFSPTTTYSTWAEYQAKKKKKSDELIPFPIFSLAWLPYSLSPSPPTPNLGTILFGGGGGKKGTGVESGLIICSPSPTSSPSTPIELTPLAFLSTHDSIVMHALPHPLFPELALAIGSGTVILHHSPPSLLPLHSVQTDFSKELSSQAQAISPSGDWLATGGEDRCIRVWRYSDLRLLAVLGEEKEWHRDMVLTLEFNCDGTVLASCGGDSAVKLWDMSGVGKGGGGGGGAGNENEKERKEAAVKVVKLWHEVRVPVEKGQTAKFQAARFVGGARLEMKAVEGGEEEGKEEKEEKKTEGLRHRKGGDVAKPVPSSVSSASSPSPLFPEQLIAIVNLSSRTNPSTRLLSVLIPTRSPSPSPSPPSFPLVYSVPIGKAQLIQLSIYPSSPPTLALASNDGTVSLYSVSPSSPPSLLHSAPNSHDLPATGVAFSPDGRWLCSASADRTFRFFDVDRWRKEGGERRTQFWLLVVLVTLFVLVLVMVVGWVRLTDEERAGMEDLLRVWLTGQRSPHRRRMNG